MKLGRFNRGEYFDIKNQDWIYTFDITMPWVSSDDLLQVVLYIKCTCGKGGGKSSKFNIHWDLQASDLQRSSTENHICNWKRHHVQKILQRMYLHDILLLLPRPRPFAWSRWRIGKFPTVRIAFATTRSSHVPPLPWSFLHVEITVISKFNDFNVKWIYYVCEELISDTQRSVRRKQSR